ncbi:DNA polymerase III subunit beta [Burkholderia cenocepacia]|uniref:DNA polymerase III subunit beta family protein n=1 Tax=Burkholderia cenocepacia TaxID=95486 RepID=UPI001AA10F9F|nr:DNA polymerase III subunit beta [Burkholderia cenocepacia]MBO1859364.1 DNA polymerase III subunit beta [Burkholderia cenocepacia]MDR5647369.1 DNA polymerase III subunit beta [Burkholderia cenocepacia]
MIVHVTGAALKAALLQAGKQDIRYYLNGICVEAYEKETRIIATDGHRMAVVRVRAENFGVSPGTQFIIPRATVEALKVTKPLRDLPISIEGPDEKTGEYRMTYATDVIIFRAVEGKFPDYRRVVPQRTSGEPTQLNPAYLLDMRKSVELLGSKRIHVQYNGTDATVITAEDTKIEFVGVVMPERWTDKDQKPHVPPDTSWVRT